MPADLTIKSLALSLTREEKPGFSLGGAQHFMAEALTDPQCVLAQGLTEA